MSKRFASSKVISYGSAYATGLGLMATTACLAAAAYGPAVAVTKRGPPVTNETPLGYRIDLTVDPAAPRFSGHVEIDFKLRQQSRVIHLDGSGINVTHVEVRMGGKVVSAAYRQIDSAGHAEVAPAA